MRRAAPRLQWQAAFAKLGHWPHLDKVFRDNARGIFEKLGTV